MGEWLERALAHDWTGVFATVPTDQDSVVVTACHHVDNAFYELGVMDHEVTPQRLFAVLPEEPPHDCTSADICWMLDLHTPEGTVDNREVTAEQASDLLGKDVWELLAVGRANHEAWVGE